MAGNPFRRSVVAPPLPSPGVAGREAAADPSVDASDSSKTSRGQQQENVFGTTIDLTVVITNPKKVVKRVRIQSPVISPDESSQHDLDPFDARVKDEGHPGSPPPPDQDSDIAIELRKSFIDSVARGASNLNREVVGDVAPQAHMAGLGINATASNPVQHQAPHNPFSKTLASIEGGYTSTAAEASNRAQPAAQEHARQEAKAGGKAAMDVDSFTRMLLTGKPAPAASAPANTSAPTMQPASQISVIHHDSDPEGAASSTRSDHEPSNGSELSRLSYEDSRADTSPDTNEQASLASNPASRKSKPPPLPAHHRGKLLSKKGPQVVSFADFDDAFSPASGQQSPAVLSPGLPRSLDPVGLTSAIDIPLPTPPTSISPQSGFETSHQKSSADSVPRPSSDAPPPPGIDTQNARLRPPLPPPPPVSRRSSQSKTVGPTTRPRSSSNLSKSSTTDDYPEATTLPVSTSPSLQYSKPVPPPSRRVNPASSSDRDPSVSRSNPEASDPGTQSATSKAPPPPPSRQVLRGAPNLTRTPSIHSVSSIGDRRVSPSLSQAPPPPPPRRGDKRSSFDGSHLGPIRRPSDGGSQRGSGEIRRSSGTSFDSPRTPSISSLHNVPEGEDVPGQDTPRAGEQHSAGVGGKDILADLSAFQAEIDALRAQIGH